MARSRIPDDVDLDELRATIELGIFRRVQAGEPLTPPDDPVRRRLFEEALADRSFRENYRANPNWQRVADLLREKSRKGQ